MDTEKKNNVFTIILIIVIIAAAGYYAYQKWMPGLLTENTPDLEESISDLNETSIVVVQDIGKCVPLANVVIDGQFQKVEDNLIYLASKDNLEFVEIIALNEETKFSEIKFSSDLEMIEEKEISLTDFKEGDNISIVALCGESELDKVVAANIRIIIVLEGEGAEDIPEGSYE